MNATDKMKEAMKALHLELNGTLEENEESYSFEDSWARFSGGVKKALNTTKEEMAHIRAEERRAAKTKPWLNDD